MNTGMQDAIAFAEALATALNGGNEDLLNSYGAVRRPIARQVVALADRLTRLATVSRQLRSLRNTLLRLLACIPSFRHRLAWRLSGLAYR